MVSVRDLRNHGGEVLDAVARGATLTITKDGEPVAELRPVPRKGLSARELVAAFQGLPQIDAKKLRAELDEIFGDS